MVNNHIRDDIIIIAILSIIIVYTIAFQSISNRLVSRNIWAFLAKGFSTPQTLRQSTHLAIINIGPHSRGGGNYSGFQVTGMIEEFWGV